MRILKISSSNIAGVGYLPLTKTLRIEFTGGGTYDYEDVSRDEVLDLLFADSIGGHFAKHIRLNYQGIKITPPAEETPQL